MDANYWQAQRSKRSSVSAGTPYSPYSSNNNLYNDQYSYSPSSAQFPHQPQQQQSQYQQQPAAAAAAQLQYQQQPQTTYEQHQEQPRSTYYEGHYPLCNTDWSNMKGLEVQSIALSTYRDDPINKLQILHGFPNYNRGSNDSQNERTFKNGDNRLINDGNNDSGLGIGMTSEVDGFQFYKVSEASVNYPITHLQWDPSMAAGRSNLERLATSSDCLRIYDIETDQTTEESKLIEKLTLTNSKNKNFNQLPPLTSFDWNTMDPNLIITGSIDTTCTLWDLSKGSASMAKTQLIAHDSEVFDVSFLHGTKHIFTSCGNDGSIRVFDLRSLEHSTIIYEPQLTQMHSYNSTNNNNNNNNSNNGNNNNGNGNIDGNGGINGNDLAHQRASVQTYTRPTPLLRLETSNYNVNHIATIEAHSNRILILDLRFPGVPLKILENHSGPVNSIKWHPTKNYLLSGGDDCQALLYDLNSLEDADGSHIQGGEHVISSDTGSLPISNFCDELEINDVTWNPDGDWIGIVSGKGFQGVKV
ncbi:hypothetical protein PACTADRAFT_51490 [Pachysolen tannophilus NRRL Y-2460]|uniref:Histone-binding protein RBBP4 N-terminal domain-containing protein n=1 Tax=Pachysolen tannophilus NRRL Y-2460 TaxID=669874 RepID=A0A1E4TPP9_PACTA|nr:hypothetical protein PACTADRAFT_51490 [Pachysolen tannophilus NRRL Y-2460]